MPSPLSAGFSVLRTMMPFLKDKEAFEKGRFFKDKGVFNPMMEGLNDAFFIWRERK